MILDSLRTPPGTFLKFTKFLISIKSVPHCTGRNVFAIRAHNGISVFIQDKSKFSFRNNWLKSNSSCSQNASNSGLDPAVDSKLFCNSKSLAVVYVILFSCPLHGIPSTKKK